MNPAIAIPTLGRPKYLSKLLNGLLDQEESFGPLPDIYIFNHTACGATRRLVKSFGKKLPIHYVGPLKQVNFAHKIARRGRIVESFIPSLLGAGIGGIRNFMQLYLRERQVIFLDDDMVLESYDPGRIPRSKGDEQGFVKYSTNKKRYPLSINLSELLLEPLGKTVGEVGWPRGFTIDIPIAPRELWQEITLLEELSSPYEIKDNQKIVSSYPLVEGIPDLRLSSLVKTGLLSRQFVFLEPAITYQSRGYGCYAIDLSLVKAPFVPNEIAGAQKDSPNFRYEDIVHSSFAQRQGVSAFIGASITHDPARRDLTDETIATIDAVSDVIGTFLTCCVTSSPYESLVAATVALFREGAENFEFAKPILKKRTGQEHFKSGLELLVEIVLNSSGFNESNERIKEITSYVDNELLKAEKVFIAWPHVLKAASTL